jgi:hypothetical protein
MVQQEHVQIVIQVVVKKCRLGAEGLDVQSVGSCLIFEFGNPGFIHTLVDEEAIGTLDIFVFPYFADIDVKKAIAVDVDHGHAGGPPRRILDTGFQGYFLEPKVALIQIKVISYLVPRKIQIDKTIIVEIPRSHPASVIVIQIGEYVEFGSRTEVVAEFDPGLFPKFEKLFPISGCRVAPI